MVEVDDDTLVAELREAFGSDSAGITSRSGGGFTLGIRRGFGSTKPDREELPPGSRLDDFEIIAELGRGGMGVVYRARQLSLGREVALKVLPGYARQRRAAVKRFQVEAQAAARLHHVNIVPIFAHGEADGHFYYVMELIEGRGLDEVLAREPDLLSSTAAVRSKIALESQWMKGKPHIEEKPADQPAEIPTQAPAVHWTRQDYVHLAGLFAEVADGLEHAHANGVIHRDMKPPNVMVGTDARLHITDFGLARLADEPNVTLSGELLGTPAYLAPEQLQGDPRGVDHRTDIYSFGVTLYEVLTGQRPFAGATRDQIIHDICHKEPAPLRRIAPRVPRDLETICLRAMEKDPDKRFPTAGLLAEDLRRFVEGRPVLSKSIGPVGRAARWSKRHKALTVAGVLLVVSLLLGGGYGLQVRSANIERGNRLADEAYYRLTYEDYSHPEVVADDLARAGELGADSLSYQLASGLASIGRKEPLEALPPLQAAVDSDPGNVEALYLLAFAQRKIRELEASRQTYQRAEELGGPVTPAGWFFRGMAVHYFSAEESIHSFRQAHDASRQEGGFFQQAVLHLGRAYNQCLYADRTVECFEQAESWLDTLITQKYYGAYPYYLLSITHQLMGEVQAMALGLPSEEAQGHFADSLYWAREGQKLDATHAWSVMAEAGCLELMGDYGQAIEVRTRALQIDPTGRDLCENYHYLWRLHFWNGNLDAAEEFAALHAECVPGNLVYAYVYPALIHAEAGRLDQALNLVDAMVIDDATAERAIWAALMYRLLGAPEAAEAMVQESADLFIPKEETPTPAVLLLQDLYDLHTGAVTAADLVDGADKSADRGEFIGAVHYHAGILALASGDRVGSSEHLEAAYRVFDGAMGYTYHADVLRRKLQTDAEWPRWLGPSAISNSGGE